MKAPINILMLEDSPADVEIIRRVLDKSGIPVEYVFCDTKNAFCDALATGPDIILADNSLPQFSGPEALDIARAMNPRAPFILVTGTVSEEFAVSIMKRGADDYILKDRLERLPSAIEAVLKQRTVEKEHAEATAQQALYAAIVSSSDDAIISKTLDGHITSWNHGAEKLFGYTAAEVVGQPITLLIPEELRYEEPAIMDNIKKGKRVDHYETWRVRKNGSLVAISLTISPVTDKKGQVIGASKIARDITGRKAATLQKEFEHNNLHALINNTADLIWSVDREYRLITYNKAFDRMVRVLTGSIPLQGSSVLMEGVGTETLQRYGGYYRRAFAGETFTETEHLTTPVESWLEISFSPIRRESEIIGTACFSRDITARKKTEEALQTLQEREHIRLTEAMLAAQEKERNAIGIELHDNVSQLLVGTNLLLSLVRNNPPKHLHMLSDCMDNIKKAVDENRKIAHELVTPDQASESLLQQIGRLCQTMLEPAGIKTSIHNEGFSEALVDDTRKLAVYRILQEQCTNIVKHARASLVAFSLSTSNDIFTLRVMDDGIGAERAGIVNGIGLQNMISRLSVLGGALSVDTQPGSGFALQVRIPLSYSPDGHG